MSVSLLDNVKASRGEGGKKTMELKEQGKLISMLTQAGFPREAAEKVLF